MAVYILPTFVALIIFGTLTYKIVAPRRWMKLHGDGNYSPLRRVYANAGQGNKKNVA